MPALMEAANRCRERDRALERRGHSRMESRFPVELRRLSSDGSIVCGVARNVSTGGMYVEAEAVGISEGDRLSLLILLPPSEGVSPYIERGRCTAEVVRARRLPGAAKFGLGLAFLDRLRFSD